MVWAVALVAIMGLVAMAIDLGNITQTKQHTANAAQDAVLSAVGDLVSLAPGGTGTTSSSDCGYSISDTVLQEAVACAEDYLHLNYPTLPSSTDAAAAATYDSCGTALPSTIYFLPGEDCFGFFNPADAADNSTSPNAMAVAVPARTVNYTFGRVAGLTSQKVSSVAYASVQTADNGYILPYGFSAVGGFGYNCIKNQSGNTSCLGALQGGQFGLIDNPRYVIFPGQDVSNGALNYTVMTNIDLGIDHPLLPYASGSRICDWGSTLNGCDTNNAASPFTTIGNYLNTGTGQNVNDVTGPLFTGTSTSAAGCALSPRFAHPDGFIASQTCSYDQVTGASSPYLLPASGDTFGGGSSLNGVPIATFLTSGFKLFPLYTAAGCRSLEPPGGTSTPIDQTTPPGQRLDFTSSPPPNLSWGKFNSCLSTLFSSGLNLPNGTYVFSSSIEKSPRFGIIPVVDYQAAGFASRIKSLDAVYLDIAIPKSGSGQGQGAQSKVGAIQAWVFPVTWIQPQSTSGGGIGQELGGNYVTNLCAYGVNC